MTEYLPEELPAQLKAMGEPSYAAFASSLLPGLSRPLLGIRLPRLKQLARNLARCNWRDILNEGLPGNTFEEVMLRGLIIGYAPMPWDDRWKEITAFADVIDNWSVCDTCCALYKEAKKHRAEVWPRLVDELHAENEFRQRFAIVMMMDHFLHDCPEDVLAAWAQTSPCGYYAEMALGWGMAEAYLRFPDRTLPFLLDKHFPAEGRKKAFRKILESQRTTTAQRQQIKALQKQHKS